MKNGYKVEARKRTVNLTLNEDLVQQAKGMTDNLSGVVESLLADFVAHEHGTAWPRRRHLRPQALFGTTSTPMSFILQ